MAQVSRRWCPYCKNYYAMPAQHACPGLVAARQQEQRSTDDAEDRRRRWMAMEETRELVDRLEREDRIRRSLGWMDD